MAEALALPDAYFEDLRSSCGQRRRIPLKALRQAGFACASPEGAYCVLADIRPAGFADGDQLCRAMVQRAAAAAAVPGSSFFHEKPAGAAWIRFCFCKKYESLEEAGRLLIERLRKL